MNLARTCLQALAALALINGALNTPALAQSQGSYPQRSVRLVVPFPPGSGSDVAARVLSQHLSSSLGQSFVVDNKPGAAGNIGAMEVVRATPDGYTLFFGSSSSLAANVSLLKTMPYDPAKDFTPVAGVADSVTALIVRSNHPAKTLPEFIAWVKQRPGKVNASYGSSSTQISLALLNKVAGLDVTGVPYKGTPLAVNDLLSGSVDFTFADLGSVLAHVKAGTLRGIALTTPKRSPMIDLPPIADTYPAYEDITGWIALTGPLGLPKEIADKLSSSVQLALQQPEVKGRLAFFGLSPMPMAPEPLRGFIQSEIPKWARLAKTANIQPE
jgi:tripartite-type tricarboxylate transporter receptor subunit TctC